MSRLHALGHFPTLRRCFDGDFLFTKGGTTEKIWFYDMEHDGYSLDDKRQKVAQNDIPDESKA